MGRKQTGTRMYIHFCIACVTLLSLLGCVQFEKMTIETEEKKAQQSLQESHKLIAQENYEEALNECQKALSLASVAHLEEEAIFNMGLIYAHSGNPKRDYGKSLDLFKRLVKDYPNSPLVEQATAWIGILEENRKLSQSIEKSNEMIEKLNVMIEKSKQVDIEIEEKKREKVK
jgi:outer membrane protein assembly factor BamD (BamD/ComL family)